MKKILLCIVLLAASLHGYQPYEPLFIGGSRVPLTFDDESNALVKLTRERHYNRFVKNDYGVVVIKVDDAGMDGYGTRRDQFIHFICGTQGKVRGVALDTSTHKHLLPLIMREGDAPPCSPSFLVCCKGEVVLSPFVIPDGVHMGDILAQQIAKARAFRPASFVGRIVHAVRSAWDTTCNWGRILFSKITVC